MQSKNKAHTKNYKTKLLHYQRTHGTNQATKGGKLSPLFLPLSSRAKGATLGAVTLPPIFGVSKVERYRASPPKKGKADQSYTQNRLLGYMILNSYTLNDLLRMLATSPQARAKSRSRNLVCTFERCRFDRLTLYLFSFQPTNLPAEAVKI